MPLHLHLFVIVTFEKLTLLWKQKHAVSSNNFNYHSMPPPLKLFKNILKGKPGFSSSGEAWKTWKCQGIWTLPGKVLIFIKDQGISNVARKNFGTHLMLCLNLLFSERSQLLIYVCLYYTHLQNLKTSEKEQIDFLLECPKFGVATVKKIIERWFKIINFI